MKNELGYFTDSVNKLIEGKLILVDKNIAQVLKCVATVPALCKCLSDTVRTTSYVTEFSRARVTWTKPDGSVEARLKLPAKRNRLFAFVVCLLTEVDSGRRNFLEFLKEYYHEADSNVGYEKFVNEVLRPFKQAGETILHTVDPESLNVESAIRAERYFNGEKVYIESSVLNKLVALCNDVRSFCSFANVVDKDDILRVCDYFTNALYLKNPRILGVSWLAMKASLKLCPELENILQNMSQLVEQIAF